MMAMQKFCPLAPTQLAQYRRPSGATFSIHLPSAEEEENNYYIIRLKHIQAPIAFRSRQAKQYIRNPFRCIISRLKRGRGKAAE